jgi:WD40 repeat protein
MLRWLSFFGALAVVAAGVVFYLYKGPPPLPFEPGPGGDGQQQPRPAEIKQANAGQATHDTAPAPVGPWTGVVAIRPRVVITGARVAAIQAPQVPSMREGQLLFLGTELTLKPGEPAPPKAFKYEMVSLVTEADPLKDGEGVPPDWVTIKGKYYRPLGAREEMRPKKVELYPAEKWFVPVDEGTKVQKGQMLGLIDPVLAVDELASKLAKFNASEEERLASEKTRDYFKEQWLTRLTLHRQGSATREEVNEARAGMDRYAQESLSKAEAVKVAARELRQTETILHLHEIRSKIEGRVKRPIKFNSESVHSLDPVLEMVDLSKLRIRARVDLQDLGGLPDPEDPQDGQRLVDVEVTREVPPLPRGILAGHMGEVTGVAVSKDSKQIVSVSDDGTVRVWDLKLQGPRTTWRQPRTRVRAVACTGPRADKNLCLTGAADGVARLYDLADLKELRPFEGGHKAAITSVAFSPDGRWAVTGGEDNAICLWDVASGQKQAFPAKWGHGGHVTSVTFLASGPEDNPRLSVVSAGRDDVLRVWPLKPDGSPEQPAVLEGRGGEVLTLGVNARGNQLLFDQGRHLQVLSAEEGHALVGSLTATGGTNFSRLALFSPDGNLILASGGGGRLGLWRAPTDKVRGHELERLVWTSREEQATTTCGAFAPDGSFLVTGTQGRNVIVWPMPKKEDVERRLVARVFNRDPEVSQGTVRVTLEMDDPPPYLLPGDAVTLVVYPEK